MKPYAFLPILLALALLLPATSGAQLMSTADYTRWNELVPERISSTYHTIIGAPGTLRISGSGIADAFSPTFGLNLPCSFYYLGVSYPAGYPLTIGISGFLTFNPGCAYGRWPYEMMPSGFDAMIIPFWSDLKTAGGPDQGIFYRTDVDPMTYDTTLTIEWSVETMSRPYGSGRFQAHLQQVRPHPSTPGTWRTKIVFEYDHAHRLDRTNSFGAVIGLKNHGQGSGDPGPISSGVDDDKLLMLVDPGAILPDSAAITRLPTRGSSYTPDWYAGSSGTPSSFYHYGFPDSNYAVMPIIIDVMPDYMPPPCPHTGHTGFPFLPSDASVAAAEGTTATIIVRNEGVSDQYDVPAVVKITRGQTVVMVDTIIADTLRALTSFSSPIQLPTSASGEYRMTVTTELPGDQNRGNDTLVVTYFVSAQHDGAATGILSPVLTDGPGRPRYMTGAPIPISVMLGNNGTLPSTFQAGYSILDEHDSIVAGGTDTIHAPAIPPMTEAGHFFGNFIPSTPGRYRIDVSCSAAGDQIPTDDLLHSMPRREWTTHGPSPGAPGASAITFEVYTPVDLAAVQPPVCIPGPGDSLVGATRVMGRFVNQGALDAALIPVSATIRDASNAVVYTSQRMIPSIPGGRGMVTQYFSDFIPLAPGSYCVTLRIISDSTDHNQANNMASWCFTVTSLQHANPADPGAAGGGLSHLPARGPSGTVGIAPRGLCPAPASGAAAPGAGEARQDGTRAGLEQR